MIITTTELETKLLNTIAHHEYTPVNGETPESRDDTDTYWWPDEFASYMGISEKALGGVASNLIQKELIYIQEEKGDDSCCGLTEKGFNHMKENKLFK